MHNRELAIGVVTDEVSRTMHEALEAVTEWGLDRIELREGEDARFPHLRSDEVQAIQTFRDQGGRVTAVSPGILKGEIQDQRKRRKELEDILPRSIERAEELGCGLLIVFGFERSEHPQDSDRIEVPRAFEQVAERADAAGMRVAVENEPGFWVDHPEESVALLEEIGHPALGLNWDPANMHWGGREPTGSDLQVVEPHLFNLHVKDYGPGRPEAPWWVLGEGSTPWPALLSAVLAETTLSSVTLETHTMPLLESSQASLDVLRKWIQDAKAQAQSASKDLNPHAL